MSSSADRDIQTVEGLVVRRPFGTGTKSEHRSIGLEADGRVYRLRRRGGNPFLDPVLEALVGKRLRAKAVIAGPDLIMTEWDETPAHESMMTPDQIADGRERSHDP